MIGMTEPVKISGEVAASGSVVFQLKKLTDDLLESNEPEELKEASGQLYSLFSSITGIDDNSDNPADSTGVNLPDGKAISPKDAARCVLDFARTSKFLKGIRAALHELQKRFPDEQIEILYAGCGPFAPLAVTLSTQFNAAQIKFTLLDIHSRSLESARRLFETFGKADYVGDYVPADAATYVHPGKPHLIITETMQRALENEPQVAITSNLASGLRSGGIFIPEKITIDVCFYDPNKEYLTQPAAFDENRPASDIQENSRVRINLGRIFELRGETVSDFSGVTLKIPKEMNENLKLMLRTTVTVFDFVVLGEYESGITNPLPLHDLDMTGSGNAIEFVYCAGAKPGFKYRRV